jgi:hypothetical protein
MTKRDFELIANAISKIRPPEVRDAAALALAAGLAETNPRFNTNLFFAWCNANVKRTSD